jgi:DNA replication protein DnaC
MGRKDFINRAKETIAARRADSISKFEQNTLIASSTIKEFADIDREISLTGSRIMAEALGKNTDGKTVDQIHSEYDSLVARKRQLLVENGYPEDFCDIKFHCPKCSDTGYIGINICECLKKEIVSASLEASGLYSLVDKQTFDSFSLDYYEKDDKMVMAQNVRILENFASNFVPGKSDSFLFVGDTGLGKTHLSTATAKAVIEKGAYVVYESAIKLFGDYEARRFGTNGYFSDADDDVEKYIDCDLLIIDDLGCELTNQFTVSCLYNIINTRMIRKKSTIISTNLTHTELRKRYSDRIISRIFGEFKPLVFRGTDVREQKIRNHK